MIDGKVFAGFWEVRLFMNDSVWCRLLQLGLEKFWFGSVQGSTATASLELQPPDFFPSPLIVATTCPCKDLAQGGCGRFQPINMPTNIQNSVAMILSRAARCLELGSDYGSFGPGWGLSLPLNKIALCRGINPK